MLGYGTQAGYLDCPSKVKFGLDPPKNESKFVYLRKASQHSRYVLLLIKARTTSAFPKFLGLVEGAYLARHLSMMVSMVRTLVSFILK